MRILFIHRHYPGPFRELARLYGSDENNTVLFISERGHRTYRIPGVRRLRIGAPPQAEAADEAEQEAIMMQRRGARIANSLLRLRKDGFIPDLIITASHDGYSLYARDIFPDAFLVSRADWFFTRGVTHNFFHHGKLRPAADFAPFRIRNLSQYNALGDCDMAIASSQWQKVQFPKFLHSKIKVFPDGVDTDFYAPNPDYHFFNEDLDLREVKEVVTFSSRRPSRGFLQFARSIPMLLEKRPECHVLVMCCEPDDASGRKSEVREEVCNLLWKGLSEDMMTRVHVAEFESQEHYRALLQGSTVHIYLTAPYTLSSGLFEAMSCGVLVVGSDTAPVQEVIKHGENGFLTDFWDSRQLAETVAGVLEREEAFMPLRKRARKEMLKKFDHTKQATSIAEAIAKGMEQQA